MTHFFGSIAGNLSCALKSAIQLIRKCWMAGNAGVIQYAPPPPLPHQGEGENKGGRDAKGSYDDLGKTTTRPSSDQPAQSKGKKVDQKEVLWETPEL